MWGPKTYDRDFFAAFSHHADVTVRAADLLIQLLEHPERDELSVQIETTPHDGLALARYIVKAVDLIQKAVNLLKDLKRNEEILKICEKLNEIENDGDEVFRRTLVKLYRKGNDPLEVLKWREIYDNLETALDRCEDVANQIESLVLEYS